MHHHSRIVLGITYLWELTGQMTLMRGDERVGRSVRGVTIPESVGPIALRTVFPSDRAGYTIVWPPFPYSYCMEEGMSVMKEGDNDGRWWGRRVSRVCVCGS